jgi:hypothetical protein
VCQCHWCSVTPIQATGVDEEDAVTSVSRSRRELACVHQTDPLSVLDASPPSGEPGWSSEGTGRGGRNGQRGVFGNGVTYAARGPVNWETGALGGFFLWEGHQESGPLDPYLMLSASSPGVVIRLTAPGLQRSSWSSLIVGKPHLGSRLTSQRVVRLSGSRGGY